MSAQFDKVLEKLTITSLERDFLEIGRRPDAAPGPEVQEMRDGPYSPEERLSINDQRMIHIKNHVGELFQTISEINFPSFVSLDLEDYPEGERFFAFLERGPAANEDERSQYLQTSADLVSLRRRLEMFRSYSSPEME